MSYAKKSNTPITYTVPPYTQLALKLCIIGYLALITLVTWHWILGENTLFILGIKLVPLLIFFPGMMRKQYRTFSWLCFVMLAYFSGAVLSLFHPVQAQPTHWLQLLSIVVLFNAAMMYSRWRQVEILAINQSFDETLNQSDSQPSNSEQSNQEQPVQEQSTSEANSQDSRDA